MPRYVIEREKPNVGKMTPADLKSAAQTSNNVLMDMGPGIQWLQSYVTGDKIYCVYIAPDVETVREHAARSGFPAHTIAEVKSIFDPTTGE